MCICLYASGTKTVLTSGTAKAILPQEVARRGLLDSKCASREIIDRDSHGLEWHLSRAKGWVELIKWKLVQLRCYYESLCLAFI